MKLVPRYASFALSTLLACLAGLSCSPSDQSPSGDAGTNDVVEADSDTAGDDASEDGSSGGVDAELIHEFPSYTLDPGEEVVPCVQWTLNNEKPLYVNEVTLANGGGFHHSNWFVVPEDYASGEDGYFNCSDRGFREVSAAERGNVLFAQSTQAQSEVQDLPDGSVIKIPPNHKIVANVHFLNVTTREVETFSRITLGLLHPREVDTVLTPFRLIYKDLDIPPNSEARFTGECNFRERYPSDDFDFEVYYVLPHYHELGNYFGLEVFGGPRDGEQLFELQGFNAEANGRAFDDPVDLSDADGLRFTCGYDNPRDESVGWGIGGQEMCVMLGFADSEVLFDARVPEGSNEVDRREDGIVYNEGGCTPLPIEPPESQGPPTEEERNGELYVPEGDSGEDLDPVPECEEPEGTAEPFRPPTLSNVHTDIFSVGCAFSACHSAESPAAGLDLKTRENLHDRLLNHELRTPTEVPLVEPGEPEQSWLYRVTSNCEPQSSQGPVSHMPRNTPTLLEPEVLAMIREWIERGAKDN